MVLPRANALAYFALTSVTQKKSFLTSTPGRESDVELLRAQHVGGETSVQVFVGLVDQVEPAAILIKLIVLVIDAATMDRLQLTV
jgi:hypothetical protein